VRPMSSAAPSPTPDSECSTSESSSCSSLSLHNGSPPSRHNLNPWNDSVKAQNQNCFSMPFFELPSVVQNNRESKPHPGVYEGSVSNSSHFGGVPLLNHSMKELDRGGFGGGGGGSSPWNEVVGTPATWNHTELVHAVLRNNETLVDWLQQANLLGKGWMCPRCATPMAWETVMMTGLENQDRFQWRCPRRSCASTTHLRNGSFFDRPFFITLSSFVEIIYWWSKGAPIAFVCEETGCNMDFLCYTFCLLREVCAITVKEFVVGGPGAVTGRSDNMKLTINGMVCEGYFNSMLPAERKWRQKFGEHAFKNVLEHIAMIYDVGGGHPAQQLRGNVPQNLGKGNSTDWNRENNRSRDRHDARLTNDNNRRLKPRALYGAFADNTSLQREEMNPAAAQWSGTTKNQDCAAWSSSNRESGRQLYQDDAMYHHNAKPRRM